MRPRAILAWILERPPVAVLRRVLDTYGRAAGGLLANGLAFSALFAAIPSALLVIGLAGWAADGDPRIRQQVTDALIAAMPPLAELIRDSVDAAIDGAVLASALGVVGLVWTVSQLFGALDVAFARIFAGEPERSGLGRTVRGLVTMAVLAVVVLAVIATIGVSAAPDAVEDAETSPMRDLVGLVASPPALVVVACLAVILAYRLVPPRKPGWRALLIPATLVGVVLVLFSQVFTFLVPRLVGAAELAGSVASAFVALAWLSFSFQVLLLGAAWVRVRDADVPSAALESAAATAESGVGRE